MNIDRKYVFPSFPFKRSGAGICFIFLFCYVIIGWKPWNLCQFSPWWTMFTATQIANKNGNSKKILLHLFKQCIYRKATYKILLSQTKKTQNVKATMFFYAKLTKNETFSPINRSIFSIFQNFLAVSRKLFIYII